MLHQKIGIVQFNNRAVFSVFYTTRGCQGRRINVRLQADRVWI